MDLMDYAILKKQKEKSYLAGYQKMLERNDQWTKKDIVVPRGITVIPNKGLQYTACYQGNFILPSTITTLGYRAFMNSDMASINLPANISLINDDGGQFHNCTKLTSVTFESGYSYPYIRQQMFFSCSALCSITLPSCITTIETSAFANCTSLATMTIKADTPPTLASALPSSLTAIYVPANSVDYYKTATNWSTFAEIIQAEAV